MRIAYVVPLNLDKYNGVVNKIYDQVIAWKFNGHSVKVILLTTTDFKIIESTVLSNLMVDNTLQVFNINKKLGVSIDLIYDWLGFKSIYQIAFEVIQEFKPEIVYTRNSIYQPFYSKIGTSYNLVIESNTNVESEFNLQKYSSFRFFIRFIYFRLTNKMFLSKLTGIVAVTKEISEIYSDIPKLVIPNSIDVEKFHVHNYKYPDKPTPNIFFMGSPGMPWQGIDVLLDLAVKLPQVDFDIVGVSKNDFKNIPRNVRLHGFLNKNEYLSILTECTAAIGTCALFRKSMDEACPLKVREYIACCRPVILPYKDTTFEQLGYPDWVLQIDNDRNKIIEAAPEIIKFLDNCKSFNIKQENIKKYVDFNSLETKRLSFFLSISNLNDI